MAHIHEKIDFTASVFIVHDNKVLMRKHEKYGIWFVPGGHIELDEDPNEAAIREAKEEAGLDVTLIHPNPVDLECGENSRDLIPPFFINRHKINDVHEHVDLIHIGTSKSDKFVQEEKEFSEDMRWMNEEEVKNHPEFEPRIRHYALKALEVVGKLRKN